MQQIKFIKMHGLGNDFVIIDQRHQEIFADDKLIMRMADRHMGIGCDQLIILRNSEKAGIKMLIFNADGSVAEACGNVTRCVAKLISEEKNSKNVTIEFNDQISQCSVSEEQISCNMGYPSTDWQKIPLSQNTDSHNINFPEYALTSGVAVNIGNPHIIFFVDNNNDINIDEIGPKIENHPLFPEKVNVSFAQICPDNTIDLQVWERGAGRTNACGTAACATAFAAKIKGLVKNQVTIKFRHGKLLIKLLENGSVEMIGPATKIFDGIYYND